MRSQASSAELSGSADYVDVLVDDLPALRLGELAQLCGLVGCFLLVGRNATVKSGFHRFPPFSEGEFLTVRCFMRCSVHIKQNRSFLRHEFGCFPGLETQRL